MVPKVDAAGSGGQESVVLAAFANRRAAERMLVSLGREFRQKARKGDAAAVVVSGNKDGSLKVTQSRVVTASGVVAAVMGVTLATLAGLLGALSALKGAKTMVHGAHKRESHVGSDLHTILARAGPSASIALVSCKDRDTRQTVAARAADRASYCWDGSRAEFLAHLDPGSRHDWVRAALDEPSSSNG